MLNVQVNVHNNTEPLTIKEQKREWRLNKIAEIILGAIKSKR